MIDDKKISKKNPLLFFFLEENMKWNVLIEVKSGGYGSK